MGDGRENVPKAYRPWPWRGNALARRLCWSGTVRAVLGVSRTAVVTSKRRLFSMYLQACLGRSVGLAATFRESVHRGRRAGPVSAAWWTYAWCGRG